MQANMKKIKYCSIFIGIFYSLIFSMNWSFAYSTHSIQIARLFSTTTSVENEPITVTIQFTNLESNQLRGFYYTEQIPEGLNVTAVSVRVDGNDISNYLFETGTVDEVYQNHYPIRWVLETPSEFHQANPINQNSVLEIVYTLSAVHSGAFDLKESSWAGYFPDDIEEQRAAFGHSEEDDAVIVIFQDTSTKELVLQTSGNGTTSPPAGVYDYAFGSLVDLSATPSDGWVFESWSGEVDDPYSPNTSVIVDSDKTVTAIFSLDADSDGVDNTEEQGPHGNDPNYDGNDDGRPDWQQGNVASGYTYDEQHYITIAVPPPCTLAGCNMRDNPNPANAPADVTFPYGFFDFTIHNVGIGGAVQLTIFLPENSNPVEYWKYGPTPSEPNPHWYEFNYDHATQTGADMNGDKIILNFVDADRGDDGIIASDGLIVDQGAPAVRTSSDGSSSSNGSGGGGGCFIKSAGENQKEILFFILGAVFGGSIIYWKIQD